MESENKVRSETSTLIHRKHIETVVLFYWYCTIHTLHQLQGVLLLQLK